MKILSKNKLKRNFMVTLLLASLAIPAAISAAAVNPGGRYYVKKVWCTANDTCSIQFEDSSGTLLDFTAAGNCSDTGLPPTYTDRLRWSLSDDRGPAFLAMVNAAVLSGRKVQLQYNTTTCVGDARALHTIFLERGF